MKEFKVGDRVRVYTAIEAFKGIIIKGPAAIILDGPKTWLVDPDSEAERGKYGWYHPKQCRRLITKKRRRVWILDHADSLPSPGSCVYHSCVADPEFVTEQEKRGAKGKWIEFVEVKRVKG